MDQVLIFQIKYLWLFFPCCNFFILSFSIFSLMSFCFIKLHFKKFINFRVVYSWTHFYHFTFPFVFTMSFLHFFLTSSSQLQSNNSYLFSLMSNFKSLSWIFPFCHIHFYHFLGFLLIRGFPGGSVVKNPPANAGASCRRHGSV